MNRAVSVIVELMKDESGQDLIEYALVAGLIGIGAVVSMTNLTNKIKTSFNSVGNQLSNAT
jgi:pilus assembly protein Flp/PilA